MRPVKFRKKKKRTQWGRNSDKKEAVLFEVGHEDVEHAEVVVGQPVDQDVDVVAPLVPLFLLYKTTTTTTTKMASVPIEFRFSFLLFHRRA